MSATASPPPFDAILFDLDGTLVDSAEDIRSALARAFAELGVDMGDRLGALIDGSPLEEVFATAMPRATSDDQRRFVDAYRRHYESDIVGATRPYPGVATTLEALAELRPRVRLAVATTKRGSTARAVVEAVGLAGYFDTVAGSGATAIRPKPAPDLLLAVLAELGIEPGRALMVGDTLRDVVAGQRAGMRTAAVTYGLGSAAALIDAHPDYVLEEFDELLVVLGLGA